MFKAISWGQYSGGLLLLLLCYYAYVGVAYYRVELLALLKRRGGATASPAAAPAPVAPAGRGSLIARPAAAPAKAKLAPAPVPATPAAQPAPAQQAEAAAELEEASAEADLPALDLPTAEVKAGENDLSTITDAGVDTDMSNFTQEADSDMPENRDGESEISPEEGEPGFSIGIAQLGDYFERAAEGQLTPEQLVEHEPALANTELLLSFFHASTQDAKHLTTQLYAGVAE